MKLGIVGLPNVGKSTLFNALTGSHAETGAYSNAAAKPNIGQAKVPDSRLDWLTEYYHPKKTTPATIDFVDVVGIKKGGGRGNAYLQTIRLVDALVHIVRCFENDEMFTEPADAARDADSLAVELILADIEVVERRLDKATKAAKSGDKKAKREMEMCQALIDHLMEGKPASTYEFTEEDKDILQDGGLLSVKPVIYVANMAEDDMADYENNPNYKALAAIAADQGAAVLPVAAKFEEEIAEMDDEDAAMFMEELGLTQRGLDRLIHTSYDLLGYISFLTGSQEGDVAQQLIRGANKAGKTGFGKPKVFHEHLGFLSVHACNILFESCGDGKHCGTLCVCNLLERCEVGIGGIVCHIGLAEVCGVDNGLYGEKAAVNQNILVLFGKLEGAGRLALGEMLDKGGAHLHLSLIFLVTALGVLLCSLQTALNQLKVGKDHLKVKGLRIAGCIGLFKENGIIIEASDHMDKRVGLADSLENLVALTAAAYTGNVNEVDGGGAVLFGLVVLCQPVKTLIGHLGRTHVGLCGGIGISACFGFGTGESVEKSCLAYIGKTYDTELHI
ncbi:MAG: YchF family ATPase, partial [Clostridia bacterium]|nr:YchF family ATPase [Clostridia bacterium]